MLCAYLSCHYYPHNNNNTYAPPPHLYIGPYTVCEWSPYGRPPQGAVPPLQVLRGECSYNCLLKIAIEY